MGAFRDLLFPSGGDKGWRQLTREIFELAHYGDGFNYDIVMRMPISMRRRMYFLLSRYLERDAAIQNKKPAPPIEDEDRHFWTLQQFENLRSAFGQRDAMSGNIPSPPDSMMEAPPVIKEYMEKMKAQQGKSKTDNKKLEDKKTQVKSALPPKKVPTGLAVPTIKVPDVSRLDPKFVEAYERQREENPNLPPLGDLTKATKKAEQNEKPVKSIMSEPKIIRTLDEATEAKTVLPKRRNVPSALKDLLAKQEAERKKR